MGFAYEAAPAGGPLRQGELLSPVWEHRPLSPPTEIGEGESVPVLPVFHAMMVVITPDCDLIWDFHARFITDEARECYEPEAENIDAHASGLPHILLCDAYDENDVREQVQESRLRKLIRSNGHERYHYFPAVSEVAGKELEVPELYLDFKKPVAFATTQLYAGMRGGGVVRVARLMMAYRHDLVQRFTSFQGRVAIPAETSGSRLETQARS
jgi:hypothetical protein